MAGKPSITGRMFNIANIIILTFFSFLCFYPLWYIGINSLSSPKAIAKGVYLIPTDVSFETYKMLVNIPSLSNAIIVSVLRTVLGTALTVVCSAYVSYIITEPDLPFKKLIYRFFIITMYFNAGFIPYYLLIKTLGLKNNFLVYIVPGAISVFFIILIKTYIESLPSSIQEAAQIDGAGVFALFFKVIVPLILPILACCAVFSAVGHWNAWADNMFFVSDSRLQTLQYLLYKSLQSNMSQIITNNSVQAGASAAANIKVTPQAVRLTFTFVTILPILFVYPFMQKYFVKGIMMGAVKG